jgi:hypothetical protein
MHQLRIRAPVVAPLPPQLLALQPQRGGDQDRTTLVQEPMRLRLPQPVWSRRIETVDDALVEEEVQPILRPAPGAEEQQSQLIRGQQLMLVQRERDLAVALSQMTHQLEDALGAHAHRARAQGAAPIRIRQRRDHPLSGSNTRRNRRSQAATRSTRRRLRAAENAHQNGGVSATANADRRPAATPRIGRPPRPSRLARPTALVEHSQTPPLTPMRLQGQLSNSRPLLISNPHKERSFPRPHRHRGRSAETITDNEHPSTNVPSAADRGQIRAPAASRTKHAPAAGRPAPRPMTKSPCPPLPSLIYQTKVLPAPPEAHATRHIRAALPQDQCARTIPKVTAGRELSRNGHGTVTAARARRPGSAQRHRETSVVAAAQSDPACL